MIKRRKKVIWKYKNNWKFFLNHELTNITIEIKIKLIFTFKIILETISNGYKIANIYKLDINCKNF